MDFATLALFFVAALAIARGIVTCTGGLVSHAALVARSWALPAVVGAEALHRVFRGWLTDLGHPAPAADERVSAPVPLP